MAQIEEEKRILIHYSGSHTSTESKAESAATRDPSAWQSKALKLSHPKTGEPAEYLLIDGHLQEVNWYKERYRSWFIGDSVLEDGSMYLCTPVDPLFLALPLMESNRMQADGEQGVFCEADQLLQTDADDAHAQLAELLNGSFACLCDMKAAGTDRYYRLSNEKVLAWLRCKVKVLRNALVDSSASFAGLGSDSLTVYAVGLLGEYLSEEWTKRLADSCHVSLDQPEAPLQPVNPDRNAFIEEDRANKKPKFDPKEVAKKRAAEVKAEAKAEQIRRETRGMKSISSLFGGFKCKGK
ncbi:g4847 [Coccomyxa viridis]|uniref:Ribonuclease H2 subunit B n=1 Tax=Coccomyxa viridis TaxID=1274662 RepID=A0ABP1FSS1_9CHLO